MPAKQHRRFLRIPLTCLAFGFLGITGMAVHSQIFAQQEEGATALATEEPRSESTENGERRAVRTALQQRISLDFNETPLVIVLAHLRDQLGVQIYTKDARLEESAIDTSVPVTVHLQDVRGELALELILNQVSGDLVHYTRDNLVIVSTKDDMASTLVTRVYDVRNLLLQSPDMSGMPMGMGMGGPMMGSGGMMSSSGMLGGGGMAAGGMGASSMMGGAMGMPGTIQAGIPESELLTKIVESVIEPQSWESSGGGNGVARSLNGVLIVRQTERVHAQLEELLSEIRGVYQGTAPEATR